MNKNFQIFITGWGVLSIAIILNLMASYFSLETWYSFLGLFRESDFLKIIKDNWLSLLFLFLIYPFLLGLTAYYILKFLNKK
jgi:hypothetical protein